MSVDVCLAARCWPEFFKSVAGLTSDLYPAQQQSDQHRERTREPQQEQQRGQQEQQCGKEEQRLCPGQCQQAEESQQGEQPGSSAQTGSPNSAVRADSCSATRGPCAGTGNSSHSSSGSSSSSSSRRGEMCSANCLFLACSSPGGRLADAAAQLRNPVLLSYMMSVGQEALMSFTVKVRPSIVVPLASIAGWPGGAKGQPNAQNHVIVGGTWR